MLIFALLQKNKSVEIGVRRNKNKSELERHKDDSVLVFNHGPNKDVECDQPHLPNETRSRVNPVSAGCLKCKVRIS